VLIQRPLEKRLQLFWRYRFKVIDAESRQQCAIHLKRRVLSRRTDKNDRAVFNVREKCILLTFIKAMHLVNKQYGPPAPCSGVSGLINGGPNLFNTRQHC